MAAGQPERNFHAEAANRLDAGQLRPCRTADSIFCPSPPPPLASLGLSLPPETRFERIIIRGTRTQGPSSREGLRLFFLLLVALLSALPLSLFLSSRSPCTRSTWLAGSLILGRKLDSPRASLGSLHSVSTPCWRSHDAPLPYDFHVSASGPPKLHDRALYLT